MRVTVNKEVCQGYGQCSFAAPNVFELDEDGHSQVLVDEPGEALRDDVEQAADACPVQAITVQG